MRKPVSFLLVVLVLGCIGLIACGGGTSPIPTPNPTPTPTPTPNPSPAEIDLTWNDIPVFGGTNQLQKVSWPIPPADGAWSKIEWRYYEFPEWDDMSLIKEDVRQATMFYTMEMPKNGWAETAWVKTSEANWCSYSKNNEQDGAMVWVSSEGDRAVFALMRASK